MKAKEVMMELVDVKNQILVPKLAPKLKKFEKFVYYAGLFGMILILLCALITLVQGQISLAIVELVWAGFSFIILRMFSEFLMEYKVPVAHKAEEKAEKKSEK